MSALIEVNGPNIEVIDAAACKLHSRVEVTDEDALIDSYIKTARGNAERFTRRSFINTTWKYCLDGWPECGIIVLPRSRVQSPIIIEYYDSDGSLVTWNSANYQVDTNNEPCRIGLVQGAIFPTLKVNKLNAVQITFTAGYGAQVSLIPEGIKNALKFYVAHYFENREPGAENNMPQHVRSMLEHFRVL